MSSKTKAEKFLLIQWNNGGERDVVSQRAVLSHQNEAKIGAVVTLARGDEKQTATIIGSSRKLQI